MANCMRKQTAQLYQIKTVRAYSDMAYHVPESLDEMFSRAHRLGLLNDVKVKFAKPDKLRLS